MYKPGSAILPNTTLGWNTLVDAPLANEVIVVRSLTWWNRDAVAHKFSFGLLISGTRYIQFTSDSKAADTRGFLAMGDVILLSDANTSLQVRTEEATDTTNSRVTAHFARRS